MSDIVAETYDEFRRACAYRAWSEKFATSIARIMVVYTNDWHRERRIWRRYEWA